MDAYRFDILTRRLTLVLSRRRSLGLLASLGLPNPISPKLAGAEKKKACPPCKKRKQGKCKKKKPGGTACSGGAC